MKLNLTFIFPLTILLIILKLFGIMGSWKLVFLPLGLATGLTCLFILMILITGQKLKITWAPWIQKRLRNR